MPPISQNFKLALVGHPLAHSFSKSYFELKFSQLGLLNATYELWDMDKLNSLKDRIKNEPDLIGFNVTIPHKLNVMTLCDVISEEAATIGAVNCVKVFRNNGDIELIGYNTDAFGFEMSLSNWYSFNKKRALIFGDGGAAKAAQYICTKLKIDYMQVVRTIRKENQLLIGDLNESVFAQADLIVNCTPLGTYPYMHATLPIPSGWINKEHHCFDMVYNPDFTTTMSVFEIMDAKAKNGLEMLHLQADKAWEIWMS